METNILLYCFIFLLFFRFSRSYTNRPILLLPIFTGFYFLFVVVRFRFCEVVSKKVNQRQQSAATNGGRNHHREYQLILFKCKLERKKKKQKRIKCIPSSWFRIVTWPIHLVRARPFTALHHNFTFDFAGFLFNNFQTPSGHACVRVAVLLDAHSSQQWESIRFRCVEEFSRSPSLLKKQFRSGKHTTFLACYREHCRRTMLIS